MKAKACTHCGKLGIPLLNFRWLKSNNGIASWCRQCESEASTKYGLKRIQIDSDYRARALVRVKKWQSENREQCTENLRDWRAEDWRRVKAHNTVALAIKSGELKKKPCVVCGSIKNLEAHHSDYGKPLEVTWLCRKHHSHLHHDKLIA